jgi:HEAT repeat protein
MERVNGIVAFRFLKLSKAPIEVVETLKDADPSVRRWTALVLGEIGDPKTADVLLTTANNQKEDVGVRCNAIDSIGRMKIPATAGQIEKLLTDADERVQTIAAIAFYRITGKKVKQFPAGYNAD